MKQLVILAGGKGTRLKERLGDLPKPLIDVCGIPLLERQILLAKRFDFTKVIILVNHRADRIIEFCANNRNWGMNIECIDDGEPRGTAGAVLEIFDKLEPEFLLMYGDTMLEVDLDRFYIYHSQGGSKVAATLFLHPNDHPYDSDLVEVNETGFIEGFYPYPHEEGRYFPNLVNAALYCIRRESLKPWRGCEGVLDFGKELFPSMIEKGLMLRGYNSYEYIKDCGTPSRIDKVRTDFESGRIERSRLIRSQKAVFIDRDGTLNQEVDHLTDPEQLKLILGTEQAIRRLNNSEYRVCVVTNQPVIARGECSLSTVRQIHNKLETLLGKHGAYIDRISYCPHHPDKGFLGEVPEFKIDCECRKPKTGMIDTAVNDLNIDTNESWLIGDTSTDILTAKKSKIRSILVETGYAGLDQKYWVTPDYVFPNFSSAVNFIIDIHPRIMDELTPYAIAIKSESLVLVGGHSRSGKSTFSSILSERLARLGKTSHVISTDRWLLSVDKRNEGIMGRHDLKALIAFVRTISNKNRPYSISIPGYNKINRTQMQDVELINIEKQDIIILEGVVALALAEIFSSAVRIFIRVDESVRRLRVIREYMLRGLSEKLAEEIYEARLIDEFNFVAQWEKLATSVHEFADFTSEYIT